MQIFCWVMTEKECLYARKCLWNMFTKFSKYCLALANPMNVLANKLRSGDYSLIKAAWIQEENVIRIWSNCLLYYLQSLYNTHPALANKPMKNNHGEEKWKHHFKALQFYHLELKSTWMWGQQWLQNEKPAKMLLGLREKQQRYMQWAL